MDGVASVVAGTDGSGGTAERAADCVRRWRPLGVEVDWFASEGDMASAIKLRVAWLMVRGSSMMIFVLVASVPTGFDGVLPPAHADDDGPHERVLTACVSLDPLGGTNVESVVV